MTTVWTDDLDWAIYSGIQSGKSACEIGETIGKTRNAVLGRTAKRKLAGERELSAEELGRLIRSERGFEFIAAIMAGHRPAWWRICEPLMDAADIRKMQLAAQNRIKKILVEAIDADQSLSASIAQADALAFYGSEQAGVHADALRSMARPPHHRAVAQKPKR